MAFDASMLQPCLEQASETIINYDGPARGMYTVVLLHAFNLGDSSAKIP